MDRSEPLSSFPSRPFDSQELDDLADTDRMVAVLDDQRTTRVGGPQEFVFNCVFVTDEHVSAAVFDEDDETWYRVYREPRSEAELAAAYDAVREARDSDGLFSRAPLTVREAAFENERGAEDTDYAPGEEFDCPVCDDTHTVERDDPARTADVPGLDSTPLSVECPEARNGRLIVAVQTPAG